MAHISPSNATVKLDARVERTRKALRDALLALLEEQPFDQITIRDIAARARAGYATYFRHYPDKATLLNDLAAASVSELLARAFPILEAADTRASCVALCSYVHERRKLWSVLLTGGASGNLREEFVRQGRKLALVGQRPASDSWLPPDLAVVLGVSGTVEILAWWLEHKSALAIDEVAEVLDHMVIAPILATASRPKRRARKKTR